MYRIMIVEDDRGILESVAAQVRHWGFEALCADDFREAMAVPLPLSIMHCKTRRFICIIQRENFLNIFSKKSKKSIDKKT